MAPTYPENPKSEPQREQHCLIGHNYELADHWMCYGCGRWFDDYITHGCKGKPDITAKTILSKKKQLELSLSERRNEQIKRAYKKDRYYKSKQLFR